MIVDSEYRYSIMTITYLFVILISSLIYMGCGEITTDIIDKCVGLFIVAALVPTAISTLQDANTDGWSATTITLWGLLSILTIVGLYKWVTG